MRRSWPPVTCRRRWPRATARRTPVRSPRRRARPGRIGDRRSSEPLPRLARRAIIGDAAAATAIARAIQADAAGVGRELRTALSALERRALLRMLEGGGAGGRSRGHRAFPAPPIGGRLRSVGRSEPRTAVRIAREEVLDGETRDRWPALARRASPARRPIGVVPPRTSASCPAEAGPPWTRRRRPISGSCRRSPASACSGRG